MAGLKSYTCSKCSGVLVFDNGRDNYACPFCGTSFQSGAFHSEELFAQANSGLEQKAFELAKEKYNLILEEDPHNFNALLGSVLCETGISSVSELEDHGIIKDADPSKISIAVKKAKDNATIAEALFFDGFMELIDLAAEIRKTGDVKKEVTSGETKERFERSAELVSGYDKLKGLCIMITAFLLGGTIIFLVLGGLTEFALFTMIGVYLAAALIFALICLGHLMLGAGSKADAYRQVNNVASSAKAVASRKEEAEIEEYKEKFSQMMKSFTELKESALSSPEIERTEEDSNNTATSTGKNVICDKCGAELSLDDSGRFYSCKHCGVAYGVSLFFGHSLEKALNVLNAGYFEEADSRLSYFLMHAPSDFDARLGRILCCGRWTKISDVDYSNDTSLDLIRKLENLTKEATENVAEPDKEFFVEVRELTNILTKIMLNRNKQNKLISALEKLEAAKIAYSYSYDYVKSDPEKEKRKLDYDLRTLRIEEEYIRKRFEDEKNKLIGMRSDSVFCK